MLKYNGSNPSLLNISVELDQQINLKQFCIIFTFIPTVLVSFEAEFDSHYHIQATPAMSTSASVRTF